MKRSRLEAAGFHPVIANEATALWMGTALITDSIWSRSRNRSRRREGISQRAPRARRMMPFHLKGRAALPAE